MLGASKHQGMLERKGLQAEAGRCEGIKAGSRVAGPGKGQGGWSKAWEWGVAGV